MSLDVSLYVTQPVEVYTGNITHNMGRMAEAASLYIPLWRPEEMGWTKASELIEPLRSGLELLKSDQDRFEKYNPSNGWGTYYHLVQFVENYLAACEKYPDAIISVSR